MTEEQQQPKKEHWVQRTVLDSFTKLSHRADKERIKAGCELIKHLNQQGSDEVSKECKYALERLVRGLGSSRVLARSGFYTVLVAILSSSDVIDAEMILEIMEKELHTSGSDSKSEKGDIYMGQILGCGALLRSGCESKCSSETLKKVIELIATSAKKKSYLTLVAYTFLIDLINKTSQETFALVIWPVLKPELAKPWEEQTIDTIYLLFTSYKKFPDVVKHKFIKKNLKVDDLICEESVTHIADILINPLRLATLKHPFYEMFCIEIANTDLVLPFWNEVDKRLSKPNDNKEIIATTLLMYLLTNMQKMSVVPDLFAGNYLQLLFHRLKLIYTNHKHELNIKNINLFAILAEKVSDKSVKTKTKLKTIKSLLLYPGDLSFEKITGTKTIQKITSSLDCDGVKKLAALYKEIILAQLPKNNANFPNWTIYERVYAAQLFSKLLNFNCVADEQEWKIEQIKFLMNLGIFLSKDGVVVTKDENNIGPAVALSIKDCFYSVLSHKQKNLDDLRQLLRAIIDHSNSIIVKGEDNIPLRTQFSEDDSNCWFQMSDFIKKLKSIDSKETNVKVKKIISVFEILSIHMGFQLFKEPEMARSSLQELQTCFERFRSLGSQKQKKRKSLTEGDEVTDEPEWMEVVVDLILSILSHDSHLLRSVISCVFPHLCPYVNCTVMHQILSVLDPKNEDNPLTKSDSSDSESSDDDEDAEEKNGEEADDKNEESSDNDSENEEMSEDDDCENDTETDKLRMAISQALGHASDQESVDLDDIDEEEGKRLDKALGEAFKMIKKPKNSKKQSKPDKSLTNFRTRVLDLILIYLNNEPSMYICLEIMLPLFQVLEFAITDPHQNPLQVKVQSCIKNLCNIKKFSTMEGVTEELLYDLMSSLLNNDASSSINVARNKENSECCTFIVRCSILINPDNSENIKNITPLVELYKNQLTAFFTRRDNHLPITFFSNVLGIVWHGNWSLLPICLEQAFNPEIRPFRRALGLKLLQVFYQNYRSLNTTAKYPLKVFKKLETNLSTNISVLAESDEASDHEHFFQQLIVLLTLIKKYHKMEKSQIPDHMDWDLVQKNVLKLRRSIKFSLATKSSFNKYCAMLNLNPKQIAAQLNGDDNEAVPSKKQKLQNNDEENPVEENGVHDESNADDESKSPNEKDKKQKPKGISNEKQKLKKQAKLLRLQAQEGLESVSFSQVKMDTAENDNEDYIENNSEEEDTNEAKPKKKHRKRKHSVTE